MKVTIALVALLLLVACERKHGELDKQTVCSQDGKAYYMRPGLGNNTLVTRTAGADAVCKK